MAVTDFVTRPLPEAAKKDIAVFVDSFEVLSSVVGTSGSLSAHITPGPLFQKISDDLNVPQVTVQAIFTTLSNLSVLRDELGSVEEVFDYVRFNLTDGQKITWDDHREIFAEAIRTYDEDNPVAISQKAYRLSYEHEKLLVRADILTDARPVFDSAGLKIVEVVITHMLALTFVSGRNTENVHVAVDADDVSKLRKACDRAIAKAQTLKTTLSSRQLTARVLNEVEEE